jgi:N-carbamoyl-L-amino-acid hydrolase/ureidoglycolate amidohydrolase
MINLKNALADNIRRDIEALSNFNQTPGAGITRLVFTDEEIEARKYIKFRMNEIGLVVREDAIGNIFGKLKGSHDKSSPVWTGSHIDTVLNAGQFDGMAGVVAGIEAVRLIKESGCSNKRDIEVVVFTSEEPARFGKGCLGSRALAGELTLNDIKNLKDDLGQSLEDVLLQRGYNINEFNKVKKELGEVHSFVELHIEQGAVLEDTGSKVGIVTAISAPTDIRVTVNGVQQHAGATPMHMRKDTLTASSEIILELEKMARASKNISTVVTVGMIDAFPGASNVIPGKTSFSIDLRSTDFEEKCKIINSLNQYTGYISSLRNVGITTEIICNEKPEKADTYIIDAIKNSCIEKNIKYNIMHSGAYHDSMFVAHFAPLGMIFVPSKNGISHNIEEWTDYEDIASGTDILSEILLNLSNEIK